MTLENTAVADAPSVGQEAPATNVEADSNNLETRFAGVLDLDAPEAPEQEASPAEQENAAPEEGEAEAVDEAEAPEVADPFEGYEDVEIDGEVVKVPAKFKDGYMRLADYTRKTQAVAERAKAIEAKEQEVAQKYQRSEEEFNTWLELTQVSRQLEPAASIDWGSEYQRLMNDPRQTEDWLAWDKDVKQFEYLRFQYQQLQNKQEALLGKTKSFEQQRAEMAQQDIAKRTQETLKFAQTKIKGWTPELDAKITDFALKELEYTPEILKAGINPSNYKALYYAYLGYQSQTRQQTAKPALSGQPPAKTQTVSAKANPSVALDPNEMSTEAYVKARMAGKIK